MSATELLFSQPPIYNGATLLFGESSALSNYGDATVSGFVVTGQGTRGAASLGAALFDISASGLATHQPIFSGFGAADAVFVAEGAAVHARPSVGLGSVITSPLASGSALHTPDIFASGAPVLPMLASGTGLSAPIIVSTGAATAPVSASGVGAHTPVGIASSAVTVAVFAAGSGLFAEAIVGSGAVSTTVSSIGAGAFIAPVTAAGAAESSVSAGGVGAHLAPVVGAGSAETSVEAGGAAQHIAPIEGTGESVVSADALGTGAFFELIYGVGDVTVAGAVTGLGQHIPSIIGSGAATTTPLAFGNSIANIAIGVGYVVSDATAVGQGLFGQYQIATLYEVAAVSSSVFTYRHLDLVETLEVDDYTVTSSYYVERETAELADALYPSLRRTSDLIETAVVADAVVAALRVSESVAETAVVLGEAVLPNINVVVNETALISSVAFPRGIRSALIDEQAVITDRAYSAGSVVVEDSAVAVSELFALTRAVQFDAALVFAEPFFFGAVAANIVEAAQLDDAAFATSIVSDLLSDDLYVFGEALLPPQGVAWTANLGNWAMSRYTDYQFNSVVDGFAASAAGVYVQGTGTVSAKFESGRARMSSTKKARLEYVYTDVATPAPMDIIVTGDTSSGTMTHTYTQLARDLADTKAAKTKVGKGFHSSYYSVAHSSAAPFLVQKAELLFGESTRRI